MYGYVFAAAEAGARFASSQYSFSVKRKFTLCSSSTRFKPHRYSARPGLLHILTSGVVVYPDDVGASSPQEASNALQRGCETPPRCQHVSKRSFTMHLPARTKERKDAAKRAVLFVVYLLASFLHPICLCYSDPCSVKFFVFQARVIFLEPNRCIVRYFTSQARSCECIAFETNSSLERYSDRMSRRPSLSLTLSDGRETASSSSASNNRFFRYPANVLPAPSLRISLALCFFLILLAFSFLLSSLGLFSCHRLPIYISLRMPPIFISVCPPPSSPYPPPPPSPYAPLLHLRMPPSFISLSLPPSSPCAPLLHLRMPPSFIS
eukprot:6184471-Pleurochrysis_carterae.AAC.1